MPLSDEQKEARASRIGGSNVAVVMGYERWQTRQELWEEKTGRRVPDAYAGPAAELGNYLEEYCAEQYLLRHPDHRLRRRFQPILNDDLPGLVANIDREIQQDERGVGIYEAKTVGRNYYGTILQEGVPENFLWQVQHYLRVTGREWGVIGILNRDTGDYMEHLFEVDPEAVAAMENLVTEFVGYIRDDITPRELDQGAVPMLQLDEGTCIVEDELDATAAAQWTLLLQNLRDAQDEAKEVKERVDSLKTQVKNELERLGKERVVSRGAAGKVSYLEQAGRASTDTGRFRADHPDIDLKDYEKQGSSYRVLRVSFPKGGV